MFNYTVTVQNPYGDLAAYESLVEAATARALEQWGQYFVGHGTIDVVVELVDYGDFWRAGVTRGAVELLVPIDGGDVYRFAGQHELLTGIDANGSTADVVIEINTQFIKNGMFWFDLDSPPTRGLDFANLMLHETGHAIGIAHQAASLYAPYWEMDRQVTKIGDAYYFVGPTAVAAHGGPVPLHEYHHIAYSIPDVMSESMWSYKERTPSLLDLAILHDLGYDFAPGGVPARLTAANRTAGPDTIWNAADLFTAVDIDSAAANSYEFQDGSGGGFWTLDGARQGASFQVDADQLSRVAFHGGFRTSDQVSIRSFDGTNWSNWANFTLSTNGNTVPTVTAQDRTLARNQIAAASSLFTAIDPDGDALTIELLDASTDPNGGYWLLDGQRIARDTATTLTQDQLSSLSFVSGGTAGASNLRVRVGDGAVWSDWTSFAVTTAANHVPVVAAPNVTLARHQVVAAASLFSVADADGDSLVFTFRDSSTDPSAGYLMINGQRLATNTDAVVFAADLGSVTYRAGANGTSLLQVKVSDRHAPWTDWTSFQVGVPPNFAPTVTASNVVLARNQVVAASNLFSVTDAEGDSLVYTFRDTSTDPSAGYWMINGQRLATGTDAVVFAADLGNVTYRAGSNGTSNLQLRVSDRVNPWTAWTSFQVSTPPNFAPTITAPNVILARNQVVAATSLFSVTDPEGDSLVYSFRDNSTDPSAGYFLINGQRLATNTDAVVFAADLGNVTYRAGTNGVSNLSVRVSDRVNPWTAPTAFQVGVPPNFAPTVTAPNVTLQRNQVVAASSLFSVTDPEGDSLVYSFRDTSTDPSAGYFLINGQRLATNTDAVVFAADLGSVTYRAGTNGTSNLQLRVSDRVNPWTAWTSFQVSLPPNFAPTVTASNVVLQRNQVVAASSLFSVIDPEGDSLVYSFRDNSADPSAGYWLINGQRVAAGADAVVFTADLGNVTYRAGTNGTSNLQVRVSDRVNPWTAWTSFQVGVPPNFAPTVTAPNATLLNNQVVAASSLFSVADPEGDSLVYDFRDLSTDPNAGYWLINGQRLATDTEAVIFADQLGGVSYRAGNGGTSNLQVRLSDRVNPWTAWTSFEVTARAETAPIVVAPGLALAPASLTMGQLFVASDREGDAIVAYEIADHTAAANSGYLLYNGAPVAVGTTLRLSAADLANVSFRSAAGGDTLSVRASDGTMWSSWATFSVFGLPPPTVHATAQQVSRNAVVPVADMFSASTADGRPIVAYELEDLTAAGGVLLRNGVRQAEGATLRLAPDEIAQVSFQAGSGSIVDNLRVRAFDGEHWSNWSDFAITPEDRAPVVTGHSIRTWPTQIIPGSALVSATDPDGDPIVSYWFDLMDWSPGSGSFRLRGQPLAETPFIEIRADDLDELEFVRGTDATYFRVWAFDGTLGAAAPELARIDAPTMPSPHGSFLSIVASPDPASIQPSHIDTRRNAVLELDGLFRIATNDLSAHFARFQFVAEGSASSFITNGAGAPIAENGQLVDTTTLYLIGYNTGTEFGRQTIHVRASDGTTWTPWADITIDVHNTLPIVAPRYSSPGHATVEIPGAQLFSASDLDGDVVVSYQLLETTDAAGGGYLTLNGAALAANVVHDVAPADLANVLYRTGLAGDRVFARASDGAGWGPWKQIDIAARPNHTPTLDSARHDWLVEKYGTINASMLVVFRDSDSDAPVAFQLESTGTGVNSGHWEVDGVAQPANTIIDVRPDQFASVVYRGGIGSTDQVRLRAFDGLAWTDWIELAITSVANAKPEVLVYDREIGRSALVDAAKLFVLQQYDNDPIVTYEFRDGTVGGGSFVFNGQTQSANTVFSVAGADIGNAKFQAGSSSTDEISVRVFDGIDWGSWQSFTLTARDHNPTVSAAVQNLTPSDEVPVSALLYVYDADGDAITGYQLIDYSASTSSGFFLIDGVPQAADTPLDVGAAGLAGAAYQAGAAMDDLRVRVRDATGAWSAWHAFQINQPVPPGGGSSGGGMVGNTHLPNGGFDGIIVLGPDGLPVDPRNRVPTVAVSTDTTLQRNTTVNLASLVRVSDADYFWIGGHGPTAYGGVMVSGAVQSLEFRDMSETGGAFILNGEQVSGPSPFTVSAADFAAGNLLFRTGNPSADRLQVRVSDGVDWSAWTDFSIGSTNNRPVVITTGSSVTIGLGQSLALSGVLSITDADGDATTRYQFTDSNAGATSGRFRVGDATASAGQVIDLLAGQLASLTFQAGSAAGTDTVFARAFDGAAWSPWKSWNIVTNA